MKNLVLTLLLIIIAAACGNAPTDAETLDNSPSTEASELSASLTGTWFLTIHTQSCYDFCPNGGCSFNCPARRCAVPPTGSCTVGDACWVSRRPGALFDFYECL